MIEYGYINIGNNGVGSKAIAVKKGIRVEYLGGCFIVKVILHRAKVMHIYTTNITLSRVCYWTHPMLLGSCIFCFFHVSFFLFFLLRFNSVTINILFLNIFSNGFEVLSSIVFMVNTLYDLLD